MAILYKTDGTVAKVEGAGAKGCYTLKQMQDAVGGFIEAVPRTNQRAWCNEEGLRLKLPLNTRASAFFGRQLVGDVLVMDTADIYEGDAE